MIGGNFDAHYSKTRITYANCLEVGKYKYMLCAHLRRCDSRLFEEKKMCDEVYIKASRAK